ncbi:hypothetical protein DYG66_08050 [Yersinia enterocolitica]|nr:hypothetical protein [Yersinia enterocolitica]
MNVIFIICWINCRRPLSILKTERKRLSSFKVSQFPYLNVRSWHGADRLAGCPACYERKADTITNFSYCGLRSCANHVANRLGITRSELLIKIEKDTGARLVSPLTEDELMKAFHYMENL